MSDFVLTLPIASRERVMLRLHEAYASVGRMPTRIVLNSRDYAVLARDMLRYGFVSSKYLPRPLQVLNVDIVKDLEREPEHRTIRFEWSE